MDYAYVSAEAHMIEPYNDATLLLQSKQLD